MYTPYMKWIPWSVAQIMIRNHQLVPFSSHQMAKIWWTWPQIKYFLKTHLTSVYHKMISIPDNGILATTGAQFGQLDVSKRGNLGFIPHNECFWNFMNLEWKLYDILPGEVWRIGRTVGQTDIHGLFIELLYVAKNHNFCAFIGLT